MTTTRDVFIALLRSFHAAHSLILQEQGMLTTLTVCTILPLPSSSSDTNICHKKYIACTCNVGDSLAYVYSRYIYSLLYKGFLTKTASIAKYTLLCTRFLLKKIVILIDKIFNISICSFIEF